MSKLIPIAELDITTGVTSFTVDNVFTSTYTNYRIVFSDVTCNTSNTRSDIRLLDSSGTEINSNYAYGYRYKDSNGNNSTLYSSSDTEFQSVIADVFSSSTYGGLSAYVDVFQPYQSTYTQITTTSCSSDSVLRFGIVAGQLTATTSCRGFKYITVNAGQTFVSGKIFVFGYEES
jgi:hypothetical protein